jgi:hypothetical protein
MSGYLICSIVQNALGHMLNLGTAEIIAKKWQQENH